MDTPPSERLGVDSMKVGDVIRDKEFPSDKGIVLKVKPDGSCYVVAFFNGHASWLPKEYIHLCEVINESR